MKAEDEIARFRGLGRRRNHRSADEKRRGFVVRTGEDSRVSDRTNRAVMSGKFRAVRMDMAHLHKTGERHCHDTQKTQQPETV